MKKSNPLKKIAAGFGVGSLALTAVAFYISYKILHPKRLKQQETPKKFGLNYKKVEFKSKDGTLLKGWLVEAKEPRGLIVLSHGYTYDKQSLLPAAKLLYKNNFTTVLFDYRAHGESEGNKSTIGILEQNDLLAAIDFAKKFSNNIGVFGISMGAATAIMAIAKNKTPVKLLVLDSSFAKLSEIIYRKSHILTPLIIKFMRLSGVNVTESQPIDYVDKLTIPVFFIHGEKDELVPFKDTIQLFEKSNNPKQLWIVKEGLHGRSYFVKKKEYTKKVLDFLNRYM